MKYIFSNLKKKIPMPGWVKGAKLDKLVRKMLSMDEQISPWVLENFPRFTEDEITYAIKEAFPNLESYIQKQLLMVLEEMGYMKMLYDKLNYGSEREILFSLEMLGILKPIRAIDHIFNRLADNREHIRFEAAHTLILYKNKKVVELAVKELKEDSKFLPARLAQILFGYGSLAVLEMIDNLDNPKLNSEMIIEILGFMEDERINKAVVKCYDSKFTRTRIAALKYLSKKDNVESRSILVKALNDPESTVRVQALKIINKTGEPDSDKEDTLHQIAVTGEGEYKSDRDIKHI